MTLSFLEFLVFDCLTSETMIRNEATPEDVLRRRLRAPARSSVSSLPLPVPTSRRRFSRITIAQPKRPKTIRPTSSAAYVGATPAKRRLHAPRRAS